MRKSGLNREIVCVKSHDHMSSDDVIEVALLNAFADDTVTTALPNCSLPLLPFRLCANHSNMLYYWIFG